MSELISQFLEQHIENGDFPSAVYLVAARDDIILSGAVGRAVVEPEEIDARPETIYDLASLTKPVVTGLLISVLVGRKEIRLTDKLTRFFPEFNTLEKRDITIRHLLAHTSGFPAWKPFYMRALAPGETERESVLRQTAGDKLESDAGETVRYSDYNFLLLGLILEKIYLNRLDAIAQYEIFEPLKLENTSFNPPLENRKSIAAAEYGNEFERRACRELGYDTDEYDWRRYQIWGEVHDGNAWFLQGVAGHAGLFSNARDTAKIALQFLPETTEILKPEICALFRADLSEHLNEARSLAFELAANEKTTAGSLLAKDSFGHLGFTGTSLWIDPIAERTYILLTNRTHARELPFANINAVRRRFHDLSCEILNKL
jgi:serine-type D-Ala-D-Ala carboxypeptidase